MSTLGLTHALNVTSRNLLLCEMTKFLLYQRGQYPMNADLLLESLKSPLSVGSQPVTDRKSQVAAETLHKVLEQLETALTDSRQPVLAFCLVLGATPLSPKEVFLFELPRCRGVLQKSCCGELTSFPARQALRHLINADVLAINTPTPTNTFLFLRSPTTHPPAGFLPKPATFSPCARGRVHQFDVVHSLHQEESLDFTELSFEEDISGIEPFSDDEYVQASAITPPPGYRTPGLALAPSLECLWFQAPVHIKGFK